MELQFEKSVIPCLRSVLNDVKDQEQTQEVRLPDGMPDIKRVLMCWGQVLLRGKEWRGSGVGIHGGVMGWVLYESESGEPVCVDAWLPFQMRWDFSDTQRDGNLTVHPLLCGMDARSTSARKLIVRANVSVQIDAAVGDDVELFVPPELPSDIQTLKNAYPIVIPQEMGERSFAVEENLSMPAGVPQVQRLVSYMVRPMVNEQKVMGDKLLFRGVAELHMVYFDGDGVLHSWDFSIPYSQYAQMEREYGENAVSRVVPVVTSLELDKQEDGSFLLKCGLSGQYIIYDTTCAQLVEDAYSPVRELQTQLEAFSVPAILDRETVVLRPEQKVSFDGIRSADAVFYPKHPRSYYEDGNITTELAGVFQLLGYDGMGQLQCSVRPWQGSHNLPADRTVKLESGVMQDHKVEVLFSGDGAVLETQLTLDMTSVSGSGLPMVTGMSFGPIKETDPNRPGIIVRRVGSDTLWQIAKSTGSTVEQILTANNLQTQPDADQMLLIPIAT